MFSEAAGEDVIRCVRLIFPSITQSLCNIAEHVLASLVYHADFLRETLPNGHPVLQSVLFTDREIFESLEPFVRCSLTDDVLLPPTGIPPHVSLLR